MKTETNFYAAKYWLMHAALKIIALIAWLPARFRVKLGNGLGWLFVKIAKRRKRIASINIEKCFPELDKKQKNVLLKDNMRATGRGIIEIASCWFTSLKSQKENSKLIGKEHLDAALAKGKGVILLSFHLTTLEIGGCILGKHFDFLAMYKPDRNPLVDKIMREGRLSHLSGLVERDDLRATIRALKKNKIIWYATDQNYGGKSCVFVPFFGIDTATITSTTKLCNLTGASVVPFTQKRTDHADTYELQLYPAFESFPGEDEISDAARINKFLESYLRENPADYMWLHQRFRNRPPGEQSFY